MDRLANVYTREVRPALQSELGISNVMAVPRITKVTVNVGLNQAREDQKKIENIQRVVAIVTGQKPSLRRARKSIASFKLRAGEPVGLALTLRGQRMYDFLERLMRVALPRVRDFRGISRSSMDQRGNLTIGMREMSVFPEIGYEDADIVSGLEVTIVTTARTAEAGAKLLKALGVPLAAE